MKSTPPVSFSPDDGGPNPRAHARLLAALLTVAALGVAAWLAFNTSDGVSGTTRTQLLMALAALVFSLIGITFYLRAAAFGGRRRGLQSGELEADRFVRMIRRIRSLSTGGAVFAIAAVLAVAGLGALRILAPPAERAVSVQFSDITGRVELEYCPSLPGSFKALVKATDLAGSSTLLPVWVASRVCGNPNFQNGVWLYLNRSTVTVADAGGR